MTSRDVAPTDAFVEDLADLAAYAFRLAQKTCVQCDNYHAVWGYIRLARTKRNGFESDRDILGSLFREYTPQKGRIMIAGAADAGLLALTAQEARSREPQITVVDRCTTPLAVCRRFAELNGLDVATGQQDLTKEPFSLLHDLAFAHNVLLHVPVPLWTTFLRNVRLSLREGGVLLLIHRLRPSARREDHGLSPAHYAERVVAALLERDVALPEAEAPFRRRLEDYAESIFSWSDPIIGPDDLEACLIEAGFTVARRIDHERRRTVPNRDGDEVKPMPTCVFVAVNSPAT